MTIIRTDADYSRAAAAGFSANHTRDMSGFAEACFDTNTLSDLIDDAGRIIDSPLSRRDWKLSVDEYRTAVRAAIEEAMHWYDDERG